MTAQEFEGIKQIIQRYNYVFIEADILRYENRIFQGELLKAFQEIAELRSKLDDLNIDGSEDLSSIVPQVFEPQVTLEPLPPEIQLFTAFPNNDTGESEILLATQIEAKEAVKEAKKIGRKRKPSEGKNNIIPIIRKRKTGGTIPF